MLKRNSRSQMRWVVMVVVVLSFLWSFQSFAQSVELKGNWNPQVKARLEALIAANANQGKVCVFDFDNTTLCRDIGEATMAAMNEAGKLTKETCDKAIAPEFVLKGKKITLATSNNLMDYYEDFLSATDHHEMETTPYENGYGWVVQAMAPGTPADWLKYTKKAYANGKSINDAKDPKLGETKINGYRVPFLYPEMVELYGVLLSNGYDVYVMSASNVHTIRYIVKNYLNPQIQKSFGEKIGITPDHVLGVSLLMNDDRTGELVKDPYLVKENKKYADLDEKELSHYHLTNQICYPMTGYYGKVANILKYITPERPFLVAGDSPNDLPMLNFAENRLWMARLEKTGYQKTLAKAAETSYPGEWFIQPVLYKKAPGFVSTGDDLKNRLTSKPDKLKSAMEAADILIGKGLLKNF